MSLAEHARRELELCGQYAEDPEYSESIIRAVTEFAAYGHSGGSATVAREQLHALLGYQVLSPLTSDPAEWIDRTEMSSTPMWQNRRDPAVFSTDGGQSWYSLRDREEVAGGGDDLPGAELRDRVRGEAEDREVPRQGVQCAGEQGGAARGADGGPGDRPGPGAVEAGGGAGEVAAGEVHQGGTGQGQAGGHLGGAGGAGTRGADRPGRG